MITEPSTSAVPAEIFQSIETLNTQVSDLKRELSQALEVWQKTLADEKKTFEELLSHKEMAFQEQDGQWGRQKQAFEERLFEIKAEFDARLTQMEQNASRSLSELDDAWQRDKLEWGPVAQSKWPLERRELEEKLTGMEEELSTLRQQHAEIASNGGAAGHGPTPDTVMALQGQLTEFQHTVSALQDRASRSDDMITACVQALDYQVSVLYDLVNTAAPTDGGADAS